MQYDLIDKPDIESLFRNFATCIPHLFANIWIMKKEQHFLCKSFIIFNRDEKTIFPFNYRFPASGRIRRNNRFAARHGLQH